MKKDPQAKADTSQRQNPRKHAWAPRLFALLAVLLGVLGGIGAFTFGYGQGASYMSNDPQACINCHVMGDHYDSWQNSSHRHVAVCNDCHLPHDPVGKLLTKADNGFFHSLADAKRLSRLPCGAGASDVARRACRRNAPLYSLP
jgi:cytochrome c nitrite reductase small subunit